jgi:PPE-repeat protein
MTAPVWMALPPEVHSALLSSGPGPGPLLQAAGAWNALSVEYASAANELNAVLAAVQAGAWEGPSAESYVAAHAPYLAWLMQASANSAAAAAQHEAVAAAYRAALAAMPTLVELAANHAVHAVLVGTNFFGINTIPIALNEADYMRMWIQAATTMSTYQAVSSIAVASTPKTNAAPQIQKTAGPASVQASAQGQPTQPGFSTGLGDLLASLTDKLGLHDLVHEFGVDHLFDFLNNPVEYTEQLIEKFLANPLAALENPLSLFFDGDELPFAISQAFPPFSYLAVPALSAAPVVSVAGFAAPSELPAADATPTAPELAPVPAAPETLPAAGMAPTFTAPATAPTTVSTPATATATTTPASSAPVSTPPATVTAGFVPPYVVGPPGIGFDSGMSAGVSSSAKRKAPQADTVAAATAAAARQQSRVQRRRRAKLRGYGDQFMHTDVDLDPDWGDPPAVEPVASAASNQGAGKLGSAGPARKYSAGEAAGLATLTGDEFASGPTMPMVPGTWGQEFNGLTEPRETGEES